MMQSFLRSRGIFVPRTRVRDALTTIAPHSTACRWAKCIKRRKYKVPTPNSLWHMDGHMKLIRWKIVTHGCIDGYSRLISFLHCSTSNSSNIVVKLFVQAVERFGVPSRVRSDHGMENFFVALLMNLIRGEGRGSHITGKSVHNQRIERLWRDIFKDVISKYYNRFYEMEDEDILNPDNEIHICSLHLVYNDDINEDLKCFMEAWNKHNIRTENGKSPEELWLAGLLSNYNSRHTAITEVFSSQPSVFERFQEALRSVGYNININGEVSSSDNYDFRPSWLLENDIVNIKLQISDIVNVKERYMRCIELIERVRN